MPIRTREHILEDESWTALQDAVNKTTWVLRKKPSDYGIDGEIEIFNGEGLTTGLMFLFQLKATDQTDEQKALSYRFLKKTINYYKDIDLPVLLIRYVSNSKALYYRWASTVDFYYSRSDSESINVLFSKDFVWDLNTPNRLIKYIYAIKRFKQPMLRLPIEFYIEVRVNNWVVPAGVIDSQIRKLLEKYPHHFFCVREKDRDNILPKIIVSNDNIAIDILGLASMTIHYEPSSVGSIEPKKSINPYYAVIIGIALCLSKLGHAPIVADIIFENIFTSGMLQNTHLGDKILFMFIESNRIDLAIQFSNRILELYDGKFLYDYITRFPALIGLMKSMDEADRPDFKKLCITSINKCKELGWLDPLGLMHYNLGSWILKTYPANKLEAMHYYKMAAKNDNDSRLSRLS